MPGPIIADPTPDWLKPENASVFDSPLVKAIRALVNAAPAVNPLHTLVDPQAQVVAPMMPSIPQGQEGGGAIQALQKIVGQLRGKALGSLAATVQPGEAPGIIDLQTPTIDRIQHLHEVGQALPNQSNWDASKNAADLVRAFGGDREAAMRYATMWGATSPNTSVPVNTKESVSALLHFLERPDFMTEETAGKPGDFKLTMAGSKVPNINRAYVGETVLSGDKVDAMGGFMRGEPRAPIDVHTLYGVGSATDKLDQDLPALRAVLGQFTGQPASGKGSVTATDAYLQYEDALKRALQQIAPDDTFNKVFGQFWEGARAYKGKAWEGGAMDILRKKGLLEAGAMLDPDRLRAALRSQGWTAGAISGLLAAIQSGGAPASAPEGASGADRSSP